MSLRKYYKVIDNREALEIPNPKRSKPESCSTGSATEKDTDDGGDTSGEGCDRLSSAAENLPLESRPSRQASKFSTDWLIGREHWLKYLPGQGMILCIVSKAQ